MVRHTADEKISGILRLRNSDRHTMEVLELKTSSIKLILHTKSLFTSVPAATLLVTLFKLIQRYACFSCFK